MTFTQIDHWIDGQVVAGTSGRTGPVYDPATGEQQAEVALASVDEVDAAVATAKAALPGVAGHGPVPPGRGDVPPARAGRRQPQGDRLADLGRARQGARRRPRRGRPRAREHRVRLRRPRPAQGRATASRRRPASTCTSCASRSAWWPASPRSTSRRMVPMWMFANALACGNTFVLKPSEKDPSASLFLAELLAQAGLPAGCFNVVNGDKVAVDALLEHPDVAAVTFVGSTPIARYIYETGTANGKRVQALGGAKNHMLVLPDADLDMAADAAVSAAYGSAGERCMAISVVLAVDAVADALVEPDPERIPAIKVGPGSEPDNEMGPLISGEDRDRVAGYVSGAADEGATVVVDGTVGAPADGFFLNPSLLDDVTPGMTAYDDEIFGPVLGGHPGRHLRRGPRAHQRQPVRQRHRHLHPRRRRRPAVPVRGRGGHGRHQRPHPGAGQLLQLRRLEGVALRRHPHVRARGHRLLHPVQGRHVALARPGHVARSTSASRRTGSPWTSASSSRPPRPRRGSSTWPSGPRATASPTCGPSTATSSGRSRSCIYSQILDRDPQRRRGPHGHQPGHPRLDRHRVALRHAERDVRQPHRVRHRPGRQRRAGHQRQAHHAGHAARRRSA